jgi:hypothetical protein
LRDDAALKELEILVQEALVNPRFAIYISRTLPLRCHVQVFWFRVKTLDRITKPSSFRQMKHWPKDYWMFFALLDIDSIVAEITKDDNELKDLALDLDIIMELRISRMSEEEVLKELEPQSECFPISHTGKWSFEAQ